MFCSSVSIQRKKYNIVILAGGLGTRLGIQSEYIPKALTQLGSRRAIDYIIERYQNIAHQFIIGVCSHADLIKSYIKGQHPQLDIGFSIEHALVNNAISTMYCLDHADSRYPTIICFCDLILVGNSIIRDDVAYYTNSNTKGHLNTYRHSLVLNNDMTINTITEHEPPITSGGVVGQFTFSNTRQLKAVVYSNTMIDITTSIVSPYSKIIPMRGEAVDSIFEFGTIDDLAVVRKMWEEI